MKKFVKNQKGQGIMEYVIISSLVGICCLMAVKKFGKTVNTRIEAMNSKVVDNISTKSGNKD